MGSLEHEEVEYLVGWSAIAPDAAIQVQLLFYPWHSCKHLQSSKKELLEVCSCCNFYFHLTVPLPCLFLSTLSFSCVPFFSMSWSCRYSWYPKAKIISSTLRQFWPIVRKSYDKEMPLEMMALMHSSCGTSLGTWFFCQPFGGLLPLIQSALPLYPCSSSHLQGWMIEDF